MLCHALLACGRLPATSCALRSQCRHCMPVKMAAGSHAGGSSMIYGADWSMLGKEMEKYDDMRETIIKRSREVQKLAKQAIYSLHREEPEQARKKINSAESIAKELLPLIEEHPMLRLGSFSSSIEELVEARTFMVFLQDQRLAQRSDVPLADREEYMGGVLDFCGELNRFAVARATVRDVPCVQQCRDLVDGIMGRFLQLDLRNGSLRKKFDSLKYTLKKLENTLYEMSLTHGARSMADDEQEQEDTGRTVAQDER